jgi:hypothetical protein
MWKYFFFKAEVKSQQWDDDEVCLVLEEHALLDFV